jgi:hypothetical protein
VKFVWKIFKILLAIFLVPFCIGSVMALWQIIVTTGSVWAIWAMTLTGALVWLLIYIFLPEPKWIYVLGHELTHALWSFAFGGRLKKIKVNSTGGHVLTTKANTVTTLAPYFFPFYVIIVILIFKIGNLIWNWEGYVSWFYFFIGVAYSFHITLTWNILKIKQPDIVQEGYVFSSVIIFLGNILILLIGIPLLTSRFGGSDSLQLWLGETKQIFLYIQSFL